MITTEQIASILHKDPFLLFVGAGISIEDPSNLPTWYNLRDQILISVGKINPKYSCLCNKLAQLNVKPELVFSSFRTQVPGFLGAIVKLFSLAEPNINHLLVAELAKNNLIKVIFTTNWDMCLEKALEIKMVKYCSLTEEDVQDPFQIIKNFQLNILQILKVHGCSSKPQTIIGSLEGMLNQIARKWRSIFKYCWLTSNSVFWGYRGAELKFGDYLGIFRKGFIENHCEVKGKFEKESLNNYVFWDCYEKGSLALEVANLGGKLSDIKNPFSQKRLFVTEKAFPTVFYEMLKIDENFCLRENKEQCEYKKVGNMIYDDIGRLFHYKKNAADAGFGVFWIIEHLGMHDAKYELCLEILKLADGELDIGEANILLARVMMESGRLEEATRLIHNTIALLSKNQNQRARLSLASAHNNLGVIRYLEGFYDWALSEYAMAIKILDEYGAVESSGIFCNVGLAYYDKGECDKAFTLFGLDVENCRIIGNFHGIVQSYESIKRICEKENKFQQAMMIQENIEKIANLYR